jgi:teichuronic acid biosynthesis glycosyltransferase TuaC
LMKVCMLTTGFPRFEGDLFGNFVLELVKELEARDVEVEVVAPHEGGLPTAECMDGARVRRFRYFLPRLQCLAYGGGIPANLAASWLARIQVPFFLLAFAVSAMRAAKGADLIHCHWTATGLVAAWANKLHRLPLVLSVRGSDVNVMTNRCARWVNRYVYSVVDRVLAVSEDIAGVLKGVGVGSEKIEIVHNGVDSRFRPMDKGTARSELRLPSDKFLALFVGLLSPVKGVDRLLEAIRLIDDDSLYCVLVGDGPSRVEIEKLAAKENMQGSLHFAGRQSTETIPRWMNAADLLVLPSLSEGRPNVVLEAQACGLAVVATKVGGTPELIRHEETGLLVERDDAPALAKSISRLMHDEKLRDRLGNEGRRQLQESGLTWEASAARVESIYQELLEAA